MCRALCSLSAVAMLVACAADGERAPEAPQVLSETGAETTVQRVDVRAQGRRLVVQIYQRQGSARTVTVSAPSFRGLDRADGQLALDAAAQAGTSVDCSGQPLRVLADTGYFQEQGRRSALTGGEAAWIFQAQCG